MSAAAFLTVADLEAFALPVPVAAQAAMIEDVYAVAVQAAPCLAAPDALSPQGIAAVRAVLRGAVLRWADHAGRDARSMTAGPFTIGPSASAAAEASKPRLWPSEISQLTKVCTAGQGTGRARMGWLG